MTGIEPVEGTWTSRSVRDGVHCVLAANPGPMTLDGTNTWLLHAPGDDQAVVVDPGPDDETHLRAVLAVADGRGLRVVSALLTHGHLDHSDGARRFARLAGCPVRAADPALSHGAPALIAAPLGQGRPGGADLDPRRLDREVSDSSAPDGDAPGDPLDGNALGGHAPDGAAPDGVALDGETVVEAGRLQLQVITTPGHSGDSISFVVPQLGVLLTGDTVLGRGTSVVAYPDGQLGPYLASLTRLRERAQRSGVTQLLPGHGPVLSRPLDVIDGYLTHRRARLEQVRAAVADGAADASDVVRRVYADVDESLWPAAELSVRAQLAYLGHDQA